MHLDDSASPRQLKAKLLHQEEHGAEGQPDICPQMCGVQKRPEEPIEVQAL